MLQVLPQRMEILAAVLCNLSIVDSRHYSPLQHTSREKKAESQREGLKTIKMKISIVISYYFRV